MPPSGGLLIILEKVMKNKNDFSGKTIDTFFFNRKMADCVFIGTIFKGDRIFQGSDLGGSYFANCDLTGARFANASLIGCEFASCVLKNADFANCDLTGARFADCDLTSAGFQGARLKGARFSKINADSANFSASDLTNARFFDTDFRNADFSGSNWTNISLDKTVYFVNACLAGVDISGGQETPATGKSPAKNWQALQRICNVNNNANRINLEAQKWLCALEDDIRNNKCKY
jgi:uncharacterized protein YjbI with pentapeptide repeats